MRHSFLLFFFLTITVTQLYAVRPFITDDARVVGYRLAQWESWFRLDRFSGQQWHMLAYGPSKRLEVTAGAVFGYDKPKNEHTEFSYAMPLIQGKFLLRNYEPNKPPGIGLVAGTFLPGGKGAFVPQGYGAFGFLIISQCLGENERVLIHGNIGANYLYINDENQFISTWGFGTQIRTYKGLHWVGELFSGDPYIPGTGLAYQTGFRHFISELIQIDATIGQGIAGKNQMPFWGSIGARFVTTKFQKKNSNRQSL